MTTITDYDSAHRTSWLRCRVLGFLDTGYYDDVWAERPDDSQIQLVALDGDQVLGICDIGIAGTRATINTIVVHPDHRREGIAARLLGVGRGRLPVTVETLDAWTREDAAALAWYRRSGFIESDQYLHVHIDSDDRIEGFSSPVGLSTPLLAFCHAQLADEQQLRQRYRRVYVCRRFTLPLTANSLTGAPR